MVESGHGRTRALVGALLVLVVLVGISLVSTRPGRAGVDPELAAQLAHVRRVVWVGARPPQASEGTTITPVAQVAGLERALRGEAPDAVLAALRARDAGLLAIETASARGAAPGSSLATFARFGVVEGFRTTYLRSGLVIVEPWSIPPLDAIDRQALARAARQILGGAAPPRLSQFPVRLRTPWSGEVLLELRRPSGELALWRSARASSLASGMLTTTRVAIERWDARTTTLGGDLASALHELSVELSVIVEDGTIGTRAPAFFDRAIEREHGVAYDDPASWRYLLPDSPKRREAASGRDAFRALFLDNHLREDAYERSDLRLYRVRTIPIARSAP